MTAQTLPASHAPTRIAAVAAPAHGRTYLGVRLQLVFLANLLLVAALTAVAATQLQGGAAIAALVLGGLAIALGAGTCIWLLRGLVRPLRPITEAVARLSRGQMAGAIDKNGSGELRPLAEALEGVSGRLSGLVGQVRSATTRVAINASQITADNEALSRRTDTQAESLQETAASIEQMTATFRMTAATAQQAHALARTATGRAEQGGEAMRGVVETMDAIRSSSQGIRDIIGVIDGIAFQTNILALNAAVEAARAGTQGRGFAVVAAEVRSLAQRCTEAAREIKGLIGTSVGQVDAGGQRVVQAGEAIAQIVTDVRQVAELIGKIDGISQEQAGAIESINTAVGRIDGATRENADLVNAAARTAAALKDRAATLTSAVSAFDVGQLEQGSLQEARKLLDKGIAYLRARGRDALLAEVNKLEHGSFVDRDLYLWVMDGNAIFLAHGNNPGRVGTGDQVMDLDGRPINQLFVRVAREKGEGSMDYRWRHTVTGEIVTRSAYVRREGDLYVGCPFYK